MLHKCANPLCSRLFRRMNEGRVFLLPQHPASGNLRSLGIRAREYFWLCDECEPYFKIGFHPDSGVFVISVPPSSKLADARRGTPPPLRKAEQNPGEHQWSV